MGVAASASAQEVTDYKITDLETRLNETRERLVSIDKNLTSFNKRLDDVTNEIDELKAEEARPKGFLSISRFTGILRRRKLGKLYTESDDLYYRISDLREKRKPLVNEFIAIAGELIDRSGLRMTALMDVLREAVANNDATTREWASKQLSDLWQLAEKVREARKEYAPNTLVSEQKITFPTLLSDDPEELQLWSAVFRDAAAAERDKVARLEREIGDLEQEQRVLEQLVELWNQIRRRDEERGVTGVGPEPSLVPWGSDEATKREIEDTKSKIGELKARKQESENNAERFEQQASQIDAKLKGKSEDD